MPIIWTASGAFLVWVGAERRYAENFPINVIQGVQSLSI
jgi:hypothetical protein